MKSSRSKALVVATVTGIQDINVTYPYCRECYGKLNQNCHLNEWSCLQCQSSYESDCVPYRYRVHLNIADETSSCNVSVFGKTLQPYFGLPAIEMHKFLELQHPKRIMEALKKSFIGKCFVFEFKTTLLKNSSHFCLLSVIKNNENSLFGSNLIAYQMISNNHYTTNDNIHSHLMQYKQLSCSTNLKMSQSNSQPNVNIPISDSAISSTDSTLYKSVVLSCKIKKSESQNFNQFLTSFYFDNNSSSFPFDTSKMKESHFPNDNLDFDQNKNIYKESSQALFTPRKQLQFLFGENMKPNVKNKVEMQEMYQNFENISISEMSQDQIKNIVDLSQDISAKLNPNWKSVSKAIESKDISIFNHFNKRICDCSSKTIDTCTHYSLKKEKIILCSANNSLEDVNIFLKKLSLITNPNHSSTTCNLSADLFATISEKMSNFSEKCTVSNPCESFTPDIQKRKMITSFYPEKSLLIFNYNRHKIFCQLFDDSNDSHFFCTDQSHLERRLSFSSIMHTPELKKKEKQNNNKRTVSSQNKMNRKTTRFKENPKSKSEKCAKKSINKTDFSSLSLNSCTSPNSSFNRLSSELSYIPKPKTNNCQETFTSTPISDSSVFKNVPFLICAKNCSPQLYDAFGTPMKKTDLQQEDIGCDSPSLLQNESIHCDGFVRRFSCGENPVSFDLFVTTDDSHDSLSFSAKNNDNFSHDLFSSESNLFSISSI